MAEIYATFTNNYGESRHFYIYDMGRDPNAPPVIFDGYLDHDQATDWLPVYADGSWGRILYQRSDGAAQVVDNVTDRSNVSMS